jgi:hypothetical protein
MPNHPIPGPLNAHSGPPQIDFGHPDRPRTWAAPRPHGGWSLGQGNNRISVSRAEAERLIEIMNGGSDSLYYTSSTPPKETGQ